MGSHRFVYKNGLQKCIHCGFPVKFLPNGKRLCINKNGSVTPYNSPCDTALSEEYQLWYEKAAKKLGIDITPVIPISSPVYDTRMSHYDARMLEAYSALKLCYDELIKLSPHSRAADITGRLLDSDNYREVVNYIDAKVR